MGNTSPKVTIEPLALAHTGELGRLQADNYETLKRVNPMPPEQRSADDLRTRLEGVVLDERTDRVSFAILVDGQVGGDVSLNHIIRYPMECANVGIFVDHHQQGRGVATAAIALACDYAFGHIGLHRLEAGVQPFNLASIRAFEKNGFTAIGVVQEMLLVDGAWRDHIMFQKLAPGVA